MRPVIVALALLTSVQPAAAGWRTQPVPSKTSVSRSNQQAIASFKARTALLGQSSKRPGATFTALQREELHGAAVLLRETKAKIDTARKQIHQLHEWLEAPADGTRDQVYHFNRMVQLEKEVATLAELGAKPPYGTVRLDASNKELAGLREMLGSAEPELRAKLNARQRARAQQQEELTRLDAERAAHMAHAVSIIVAVTHARPESSGIVEHKADIERHVTEVEGLGDGPMPLRLIARARYRGARRNANERLADKLKVFDARFPSTESVADAEHADARRAQVTRDVDAAIDRFAQEAGIHRYELNFALEAPR
jgi:hypothetical protein